jgi:hypothetical protein
MSGINCARGSTSVKGPGQNALASFAASNVQRVTHRFAMETLLT